MSRFAIDDPRANDWPSVGDPTEPCEDCGRQSAVGPCPYCVAEVAREAAADRARVASHDGAAA